ncbi:substrate-binding domain-containing protein [Ornithinimicrobium cryptoxanthini]|uniref:Substrate-binding domain-containing protein n=1 Tax=Ornithinimicrobium cryptoxanthini TaxID=2934161 RepID=A0ABY4YM15_9MICO|nr:substrate-binding domain-containing protein [Ornithinimicrobium cryptoxanthini]USQ77657.1 substrate-binding domain-containing protein [Ornithinimicrobium cryptoxanthini]
MSRSSLMALSVAAVLALAACAPSADDTDSTDDNNDNNASDTNDSADGTAGAEEQGGGDPYQVGIIYSETGPLAAYGAQYKEGLEAGIAFATDGSGAIDGRDIEITYRDDTGVPDTAVAAAKDLIGQDYQILGGTIVSGIALALAEQAEQNEILYISGPAAVDGITGVNDYTFRSGRQSLQDVAAAGAFLEGDANKVVVFAQDTAFGQGNLAAVEAVLGGQGAEVSSVLVPEDATEFTPFAAQLLEADPDMIFVAWAGATSGSMWEALQQQEVFDVAPVVTGLGDSVTFDAYGPVAENISFLNHYFPGAPDNEINTAMVEAVEEAGGTPDLFTPDGFVAGQMIVHALTEGDGEVNAMIDALEGWTFQGPKGDYEIRASDHALIQDMYTAKLVADGDSWMPELISVVPAADVAPPEASGK